jgi:hypothetical protein
MDTSPQQRLITRPPQTRVSKPLQQPLQRRSGGSIRLLIECTSIGSSKHCFPTPIAHGSPGPGGGSPVEGTSPSFSLWSSLGGSEGVICNIAVLKTGLVMCDVSDFELELTSSNSIPGSGSFSYTGGWCTSLESIAEMIFMALEPPWNMTRLMMFCITGRNDPNARDDVLRYSRLAQQSALLLRS